MVCLARARWLLAVQTPRCLTPPARLLRTPIRGATQALNFVDRYLTAKRGVSKSNLQSIGVTALFMASKIQEIYPPQIQSYVQVTDSMCSEEAIFAAELDILSTLNWKLSPVTVIAWVEVYLQNIALPNLATTTVKAFSKAKYTKADFYRVCQLLDFSSLHYGSVRFPPSVMAAAAMHLAIGGACFTDMTTHTGYSTQQLEPCLAWMRPFARVLDQGEHFYVAQPMARRLQQVQPEDTHNIQAHCNNFDWLDLVCQTGAATTTITAAETAATPEPHSSILLTPPPTARAPTLPGERGEGQGQRAGVAAPRAVVLDTAAAAPGAGTPTPTPT